jgi:predicted phosphohydrolase
MDSKTNYKARKVLWLTDLHLDRADDRKKRALLAQIAGMEYDALVVTGDISSAPFLVDHLRELAAACAPHPLYFVLGNHDFHFGTIADVDNEVNAVCRSTNNLHHLRGREIISLSHDTCLIGNRGWADARAGWGKRTIIASRDHLSIGDFRELTKKAVFSRMEMLGHESAVSFRKILPIALGRYRHVVVATHVPPFHQAALYNGRPCGSTHQPHFVNLSAGMALCGIVRQFPKKFVTVLAGHTHNRFKTHFLRNLEIRVGEARTGNPTIQEVLDFD